MYSILVCDDDKEIVEAIEIYLTQEGYQVLKAYDGMQALKMLETETVHLLILDVMMPRLDGIRATLKIRETNSIPIIILSCRGVHVISTAPITLWEVLSYILSIFIMSFYFVGLFTFGLCLLTASITKIVIWRLNINNNITNNAG